MAHATVKSKLLNEFARKEVTAGSLEGRIRELEDLRMEANRNSAELRRIASYLGYKWTPPKPTTIHAAKEVRRMIGEGANDEYIALYLDIYLLQGKGRGRPKATYDAEGYALQALELHDTDPNMWNWQTSCSIAKFTPGTHRNRHARAKSRRPPSASERS